jgi:hypothetical protein
MGPRRKAKVIEDINERMARFAPSQNPSDPGEVAIANAVGEIAGIAPQPVEQDDPFGPIVEQMRTERQDEIRASMLAASQVNPDQAAKASRLGERFGVGQDIAIRNMAELEQAARQDEIDRLNTSQTANSQRRQVTM